MAIPSFYHEQLCATDTSIELSQNEAAHAIKSRRLRAGQEVKLLNGRGLIALGDIELIERRTVIVRVSELEQLQQDRMQLKIATAIPKGDRQKVMIDMLTQLGVTEITPLKCEHSVTRYGPNLREKWQRAAIEACKQSQNPWLPIITDSQSVKELTEKGLNRLVYADEGGDNMTQVYGSLSAYKNTTLLVMVGPEGGFSETENALFHSRSIRPVKLGRHILRTEAAAIAVAAQFSQCTFA